MNIIQTWKTNEIPLVYSKFIEKIRLHGRNWNILFFTDEDIIKFIERVYPEYLEVFTNLEYKIEQIDFFRYLAVYHYGGLYLDLDMLIESNLDSILDDPTKCKFPIELQNVRDTYLLKQKFSNLIGNYAFYAPRKHPFLKQIIENIVNPRLTAKDIEDVLSTNGDSREQVNVYCRTGPILVTQTYIDCDETEKDKIVLIKPTPFIEERFGRYGIHGCYGSWK